jgi:hypothetical protein
MEYRVYRQHTLLGDVYIGYCVQYPSLNTTAKSNIEAALGISNLIAKLRTRTAQPHNQEMHND